KAPHATTATRATPTPITMRLKPTPLRGIDLRPLHRYNERSAAVPPHHAPRRPRRRHRLRAGAGEPHEPHRAAGLDAVEHAEAGGRARGLRGPHLAGEERPDGDDHADDGAADGPDDR